MGIVAQDVLFRDIIVMAEAAIEVTLIMRGSREMSFSSRDTRQSIFTCCQVTSKLWVMDDVMEFALDTLGTLKS
jgi:hypothetical protein